MSNPASTTPYSLSYNGCSVNYWMAYTNSLWTSGSDLAWASNGSPLSEQEGLDTDCCFHCSWNRVKTQLRPLTRASHGPRVNESITHNQEVAVNVPAQPWHHESHWLLIDASTIKCAFHRLHRGLNVIIRKPDSDIIVQWFRFSQVFQWFLE